MVLILVLEFVLSVIRMHMQLWIMVHKSYHVCTVFPRSYTAATIFSLFVLVAKCGYYLFQAIFWLQDLVVTYYIVFLSFLAVTMSSHMLSSLFVPKVCILPDLLVSWHVTLIII